MDARQRVEPSAVTAAQAFDLLECWDRIGIGIRCAYNPFCACPVHHYIQAGLRVAAAGVRSELFVHQRLLQVLLQTARDDALPGFWRSVCLEHAAMPLTRLQALLTLHDPIAVDALRSVVQAVGDELANAIGIAITKKDPS